MFFFCSHWSLVDVPLIFFCPADHVPDWQPRVLLGMVEARSVNVKKTTTTTTVQACQQHRLAVMHPNKAKLFPAATVPAVAKLGHRRRGKQGTRSEERRNGRRAHASKQKCRRWRSRGVVKVPHPTRRKNEGKNLGRKHLDVELSERWRAFARKKRRGRRAERKGARMKHKAVRARSRLEELTLGTFSVCTAAANGVNGIGHIGTLLRPCAAKGCDVIGLQ